MSMLLHSRLTAPCKRQVHGEMVSEVDALGPVAGHQGDNIVSRGSENLHACHSTHLK